MTFDDATFAATKVQRKKLEAMISRIGVIMSNYDENAARDLLLKYKLTKVG